MNPMDDQKLLSNNNHNARRYRLPGKSMRGQVLVEFALLIPVLALILAAGFDLTSLVGLQHRLTMATREGARLATENTNDIYIVSTDANGKTTVKPDPSAYSALLSASLARVQLLASKLGTVDWIDAGAMYEDKGTVVWVVTATMYYKSIFLGDLYPSATSTGFAQIANYCGAYSCPIP